MANNLGKNKINNSKARVINKKYLDISLQSIIDNIAFSKTDRWAYYRISNSAYDFLSHHDRIALGEKINRAFTNIMGERQQPLDCHLIVDSMPVDIDTWREQNYEAVKDWDTAPGFDEFMAMQEEHLRAEEYMKKVVVIGVHLGKRGAVDLDALSVFEGGMKQAFDKAKEAFSTVFALPEIEVKKGEEEYARNTENEFYQVLSTGHLKARRCTTEEILLLLKRQLYPSMPAPYLDVDHENRLGPGDIALEIGHTIRNKFRWLEISQMVGDEEMTGYRATLSFSKFPKSIAYPDSFPFIYFLDKLGLPFPIFARFTFHPVSAMKKEIEKKKKESRDEMENIANAQDGLDNAIDGLPPEVAESIGDMNSIREIISQDKSPWIEGSYHVVVETPNEETLKKYCATLKQAYSDLDINVTWTTGDQAKLFLEQMPGDRVRVTSFDQITTVSQLSASGMNYSSEVGDRIISR